MAWGVKDMIAGMETEWEGGGEVGDGEGMWRGGEN